MHPVITLPSGDRCECPAGPLAADPSLARSRLRALVAGGGVHLDCLVLYRDEADEVLAGGAKKAELRRKVVEAEGTIRMLQDDIAVLQKKLAAAEAARDHERATADLLLTFAEV